MGVLFASSLCLMPDLSRSILGYELTALGVVIWAGTTLSQYGAARKNLYVDAKDEGFPFRADGAFCDSVCGRRAFAGVGIWRRPVLAGGRDDFFACQRAFRCVGSADRDSALAAGAARKTSAVLCRQVPAPFAAAKPR